jgi:hypothetical protein
MAKERDMSAAPIPLPSPHHTGFEPEMLNILAAAFEDAWETIAKSGSMFAKPRYAGAAREIVARRIIDLAQCGERDRYRLCDDAVAYLASSYKDDSKETLGRMVETLIVGTQGAFMS